ncbi:MAG TPA: CGNR zinc finger domain-containing protein [Solirubrobacteraceae bacterium]|nr:CGNR zinc finger domain-containing protein [Solirubrobacteraceae bacterium]
MSKQQQAPGDLEHVRAFVNTLDVEQGAEQLTGPDELAQWLVQRGLAATGLTATAADLERAIGVREALRAVLLAHNGEAPAPQSAVAVLDQAALRSGLRLRFDDREAGALQPQADGVDGALGQLLAIVHEAAADGTWDRLKACRDQTCQWAFYDHTKNRSGAWCTMEVCGNRAKARAYRERRGSPRGVQG